MRWGGAIHVVILCSAGCSLLIQPGEGDVTGGGNETDSGTSTNADANADSTTPGQTNDGGGSDSTTDGGALPAGLLSNSSFEISGTIGCGTGWTPDLGNAEPSTIAHSGVKGCKVCAPASGDFGTMYATLPPATGTWAAQAWFRAPESGPAMTGTRVTIAFIRNGVYADSKSGGGSQLGANWEKQQVTLSTTMTDIDQVNIEVGGQGPDGSCVIVDDVFVEHN